MHKSSFLVDSVEGRHSSGHNRCPRAYNSLPSVSNAPADGRDSLTDSVLPFFGHVELGRATHARNSR